MTSSSEMYLKAWKNSETDAEKMIPAIGALYRQFNVVVLLCGRRLINESVVGIIRCHEAVNADFGMSVNVHHTLRILLALLEIAKTQGIHPMKFDVGRVHEMCEESILDDIALVQARLEELEIAKFGIETENPMTKPRDVVLYGFGRIGRLLTRLLIEKTGDGQKMLLRAIVVRPSRVPDLEKRADLLQRDSVHGDFDGTVQVLDEESALLVNGNLIRIIHANNPSEIDYSSYGIDNAIVIDNTGAWRDRKGLEQHLDRPGISEVILTAPGTGDLKNIVMGVNESCMDENDKIVSAASCTTNAIAPVLKAIHQKFGVTSGHIESVHSFTNDQNLLDNFHAKERRGRAAPLNLVVTETGAGKAVGKCLPELSGKLTSSAIRVPTPNVSMAIMILQLEKEVELAAVKGFLREVSLVGELNKQIELSTSCEAVSSDFVGNRHCSVVDEPATIVDGKKVVLYTWFDNEFGYSCQVIRLLQHIAKIDHPEFPPHSPSK